MSHACLNSDGVLYRRVNRKKDEKVKVIWLPYTLRHEVMVAYHESVWSGHPGIEATSDAIKRRFYWRGMQQDIANYIRS